MVAIEPSPLTEDGLYDRIGGWLVLPAIGTYLSPLFMGYAAYENLRFYSDSLSEQAKVVILGAGLTCVGLAIGWLYACVLLSRLDPLFPRVFIGLCVVQLLFNVGIWIVFVRSGTTSDPEAFKDVARSLVIATVWIPYMLISKRVKATFYGIPMKRPVQRDRKMATGLSPSVTEDGDTSAIRLRRKGHRLGIFLTVISLPVLLIGLMNSGSYEQPAWASLFTAVGLVGVVCGYFFARLWYWFRAA
jgi:hypothetical protein